MSKTKFAIEENTSEFRVIDLDEIATDLNNLEFYLDENSKATIILIHGSKESIKSSVQTNFYLSENSELEVIDIVLANNTSLNQNIYLTNEGAKAKGTVVFLGNQDQEIKIQTKLWHQADNTKGNLLCRGVLQDNAKTDFLAQITIPQGLKNIESHQNMKCLTQGEKTKCDALPILDVNSDSVVCSHGVAIGRVEEENLFYLESRGIEKEEAQRMLLHGLLMQELNSLKEEHPEIYQKIDQRIKEKLNQQSK